MTEIFRNDCTFAHWIPVADVPADRRYLARSNHLFDLQELVGWVRHERRWVNVHTTEPFTATEVRSICRQNPKIMLSLQDLDSAAQRHVADAVGHLHRNNPHDCINSATQALALAPDDTAALQARQQALCLLPDTPERRALREADVCTLAQLGERPAPPPPSSPARGWFARRAAASTALQGLLPHSTVAALQALATTCAGDRDPDFTPSCHALCTWGEHSATLSEATLDAIDRYIHIFGLPFSRQLQRVQGGGSGRRVGVNDFGDQLSRALRHVAKA